MFLNRQQGTYDLILVDAFHGGYVPFHLLTKEFYTLVKQRLAPGGAAAFNVHDGTKLYASTLLTLRAVFPSVHLYPSARARSIVVATAEPAPDDAALAARAAALQEKHGFRFPLPALLARRSEKDGTTQTGELLTDDFAPVNLYDTIGEKRREEMSSGRLLVSGARRDLTRASAVLRARDAGPHKLGALQIPGPQQLRRSRRSQARRSVGFVLRCARDGITTIPV